MRILGLGFAAPTALFLTVLVGCSRDRLVNQMDLPVSKQEEALARRGADRLRALFNKGECLTIFHDGAFARGPYSQKQWLDDCAHLYEDVGAWNGFTPSSAITCGGRERIVCIDGWAQFDKGGHSLELGWLLSRAGPRLLFLVVQGTDGPMRIPPLPQKLMDSPRSRNAKDLAQLPQLHRRAS